MDRLDDDLPAAPTGPAGLTPRRATLFAILGVMAAMLILGIAMAQT